MFRRKEIPSLYFMESLKQKIREEDVEGVKELLKEVEINYWDINYNDPKTRYTPLHFAIARATISGESKMLIILNALKAVGSDVNKVAMDSLNNTPMHTACRRGLISIVSWLISNGANKDVKDTTNQSPIDYVEKQINSSGNHIKEMTRARLQDIKIIMLSKSQEVNIITSTNVALACRFGLFTAVLIGGAAVAHVTGLYNLT